MKDDLMFLFTCLKLVAICKIVWPRILVEWPFAKFFKGSSYEHLCTAFTSEIVTIANVGGKIHLMC
jgi:hypothetical protein